MQSKRRRRDDGAVNEKAREAQRWEFHSLQLYPGSRSLGTLLGGLVGERDKSQQPVSRGVHQSWSKDKNHESLLQRNPKSRELSSTAAPAWMHNGPCNFASDQRRRGSLSQQRQPEPTEAA
ncbi:unnamed protein product [Arctogadus glacialis]